MQNESYWDAVLLGGKDQVDQSRKIVEQHNQRAARLREADERILMNQEEQRRILRERGVEIALEEDRDVTEIGLTLGIFSLVHVGTEQMGIFDEADKALERREGRVIQTIGFGVSIFEVVDARSIETGSLETQ